MTRGPIPSAASKARLLTRLARDRSGNVLAMVAAALFPLLALVGGGIDMGRGYLSQSRLQQACDAGVLAARKRLGTEAAVDGEVPEIVAQIGERFFNFNFRNGSYGTSDRTFQMVLESDYAITGEATVNVPTTLMQVFGFTNLPVSVTCQAQINMANTDVMMVLDTTGSMAQTNAGDTVSKIVALKSTVSSFYDQLSEAVPETARLRFGFVPYSTNVNVGALLHDDWVVDEWDYQSREWIKTGTEVYQRTYDRNWIHQSGAIAEGVIVSSYPATYTPGSTGTTTINDEEAAVTVGASSGGYSCNTAPPADTYTRQSVSLSTATYPFAGPPAGTQTVESRQRTENGIDYYLTRSATTCYVRKTTYTSYVRNFERVTEPSNRDVFQWRYHQMSYDVSNWRTAGNGCMEERDTYDITDYANVDLARALDLDIDLVPDGSEATSWRPMYPSYVFARALKWDGTGAFTTETRTTLDQYVAPYAVGFAACPPRARKLAAMTRSDLDTYLGTLTPAGSTYHDIGMIWGARLLSPTGLFASENADVSRSRPSSRHLIFLTDGETAPLDVSYGTYGLEPIDQRRWSPTSPHTLTQTVENRFAFACDEAKKRNISVWVISFGTAPNPVMQACAGTDRYFVADDAEELQNTFTTIARRMAGLRVTQ